MKTRGLTVAELDALSEGTRVVDAYGDVSEKRNGLWHSRETAPLGSSKLSKYGPVRLLSEPEVSEGSLQHSVPFVDSRLGDLHLLFYRNFRKTCRIVARATLSLSGDRHRRMKGA